MKAGKMVVSSSDIYMFFFCLLMVAMFDQGGFFKYIGGTFVSLTLLLAHRERRLETRLLWFIAPYLAYIILGLAVCVVDGTLNKYCFEQSVMYLLPFITALMVYYAFRDSMEKVVCLMFLATVLFFGGNEITDLLHMGKDLLESKYAFPFGAYFLYFAYKKRTGFQLAALAALFLAHKRIALLGAGGVWFLMWLTRKLLAEKKAHGRKNRKIIWFFTMFCFAMLGYIAATRSGLLDMVVSGLGINTQGRLTVYGRMEQLYTMAPWYTGIGMGNVRVFLQDNGGAAFGLLHNDILAFYVEIGFWGFVTFFALHAAAFYHNGRYVPSGCIAMIVMLYLYTFINYMTDNISIYISYLYPFYLMVFCLAGGGKKEKSLQEQTRCAKTEYA